MKDSSITDKMRSIDWDFKNYLKQIVFIAFFFGVVVNLIQNYGDDSLFTAEYTKEIFRQEAFEQMSGLLCMLYAFFAIFAKCKSKTYFNYYQIEMRI